MALFRARTDARRPQQYSQGFRAFAGVLEQDEMTSHIEMNLHEYYKAFCVGIECLPDRTSKTERFQLWRLNG